MNKYSEPIKFPPPGYTNRTIREVYARNPTTGTIEAAFKYVDAAPGPNKHYDDNAEVANKGLCPCFVKIDAVNSGRIAYYYNDTWYYGEGTCVIP